MNLAKTKVMISEVTLFQENTHLESVLRKLAQIPSFAITVLTGYISFAKD